MKLSIKAGTTSKTVNVFIQDSSSTTGAGLTGLAYNTAGLTAYYALPRAASAAITLATLAAVTSAYSSGGFKEIDATNMPGWYRFDIPDAAIASGTFTSIHLKGATNMAPLPIEIELTAWDNQDTVRGGLTALPNVASGSAGAIITSGTGTAQLSVSSGLVTLAGVTHTGAVIPTVTTVTNQLTAAQIATGVWQDATAGDFTAAGSIGKSVMNGVALGTGLTVNDLTTKSGFSLTAGTGLGNQTANITGNLSGSVGSVTGAVGSVTGSVGSVTAAVAITSNIKKNQALSAFQFMMTDSTNHAPATGKTVSVTRSIDGAAFAAGTLSAVTEVSNGMYKVDFGSGDLNGNVVILRATATGCDDTFERIVTQP